MEVEINAKKANYYPYSYWSNIIYHLKNYGRLLFNVQIIERTAGYEDIAASTSGCNPVSG